MEKNSQSHSRVWQWFLALVAGASAMAVLFLFDPAQYSFYPTCAFHKLTGLNCPGCGGLRALHQLLHGHIVEALRLNALTVVSLPFLVWMAVRTLWLQLWREGHRQKALRPIWIWLILGVIVGFGIVRNLPVPFLAQLAL